jgi:ribosomal protein S18 acetylase RimI-like enzyme
MVIREAGPQELPAVGELRVRAYLAGGFLSTDSGYAPRLRALGASDDGTVLVATDRDQIAGTIMLAIWPHTGQVVTGPEEAEIRALAVAPGAQGQGIGQALLEAAVARAASQGARNVVLSTQPEMRAAQRIYERAGFTRLPDRDWSPDPETTLLVYGLRLPGDPDETTYPR